MKNINGFNKYHELDDELYLCVECSSLKEMLALNMAITSIDM
jgi:hypothetical protein